MDIIYNLLSSLLNSLYGFTGDWGITVIVLTLLVRMVLLPVSLKQRSALEKQQKILKTMEDVKVKYKSEKVKMDAEIEKLSQDGSKNMFGCLITFLQLPILYSLYRVFMKMPMETASVLIPWLTSMKLPDPYFIIPVLTVIVQLLPNILASVSCFKALNIPKLSLSQVLVSSVVGLLFFMKAPVALGLYWVTTGLFTSFEQIGYSIFKIKRTTITTL